MNIGQVAAADIVAGEHLLLMHSNSALNIDANTVRLTLPRRLTGDACVISSDGNDLRLTALEDEDHELVLRLEEFGARGASLDLRNGTGKVTGGTSEFLQVFHAKTIVATSGADSITESGTHAINISGGTGRDALSGGGGDTLSGDLGRDVIFGGSGSDPLTGGDGGDLLSGGGGGRCPHRR